MNTIVEEIEKRMRYHKEAIHTIDHINLRKKDLDLDKLMLELEAISYHAGSIGALLFVADLLGKEYLEYEPYCNILDKGGEE